MKVNLIFDRLVNVKDRHTNWKRKFGVGVSTYEVIIHIMKEELQ